MFHRESGVDEEDMELRVKSVREIQEWRWPLRSKKPRSFNFLYCPFDFFSFLLWRVLKV